MEKRFTNVIRSTGDCKRAKGHIVRSLYFSTRAEALDLLHTYCNAFNFEVEPSIVWKSRKTRCLNGRVNHLTGVITLFPNGQRVGTLIHELAHLMIPITSQSHGKEFKAAHDKLLRFWEKKMDPKPLHIKKVRPKAEPVIETYTTKSGFTTTRTTYPGA